MRIAVTGHMDLSADSVPKVRDAIRRELKSLTSQPVGISCLARGADSIFAEIVLELDGSLEVVLPSPHYRERKVKADHAPVFDYLISQAAVVDTLPYDDVNRDAYEAANERLFQNCDRLLAVWDGQPSAKSGTATVVDSAQSRRIPVSVVWPSGATREK